MTGKTRTTATPKPATTAGQDSAPKTAGKYTEAQLEKFAEQAMSGLAEFEATVTVRQAPAIPVTDVDREFVRKAAEATSKLPVGGWLRSSIPTDIPSEVAAKLLTNRFNVIYAASAEQGFKARRKDADKNSHVLVYKVNRPTEKSDDKSGK